ncbi:hypothetical protein EXIGLDRAFT_612022 [Exidia glandulosa HHB12029]|uniref:tRNA ligase n=1 Tax=Exidia glandulosa HHB12029 TaxID=1314781 RepID=A0A166AQG0_EXIGL|nr:hypothetical protein EXIGLDRAFT_612022 [Exidia glandulosa HHB12029]
MGPRNRLPPATTSLLARDVTVGLPGPTHIPTPSASYLDIQGQSRTINSLVLDLQSAAADGLVVARDFVVDSGAQITSWRSPDPEFHRVDFRLPTLARGLWTQRRAEADLRDGSRWRIVARGYDKFFSVGEKAWSSWQSIRLFTTGPYHVTLKSDGCLIMVSALTEDTILVTSKYSHGRIDSGQVSHAEKGEEWLHRHLRTARKSAAELAAVLWQRRWTLLCELCDPSFEDHIIAVPVGDSGLRLHGINNATVAMKTQDPNVVHQFAMEWGLLPTPYTTVTTFEDLTRTVSSHPVLGTWGLKAIEGFVLRTQVSVSEADPATLERLRRRMPPYPDGAAVFFKVKFDEPYLLHLAFREVTKVALGHRIRLTIPLAVLNRDEVKAYFTWVRGQILQNRPAFRYFGQQRGVIAVRNAFLGWLPTEEGAAAMARARTQLNPLLPYLTSAPRIEYGGDQRWLILPIGLPGCGKTTISTALASLFSIRHVQFDTVKSRNSQLAKSTFRERIKAGLRRQRAVIVDGRNHRATSRQSLRNLALNPNEPVKILALYWEQPKTSMATAQRICATRLIDRDGLDADYDCDKVIWRFLAESDALNTDEVDALVRIRYEDDLEQCIRTAVHGINAHLDIDLSTTIQDFLSLNHWRRQANMMYAESGPHPKRAHALSGLDPDSRLPILSSSP